MDHLQKAILALQSEHALIMAEKPFDPARVQRLEARIHGGLNLHPDHPALVYTLGTLYSQTDRPGAGINLLQRAIALGNDGPDAYNNLGAAYKVEHKDSSAAACYKTAIDMCEEALRLSAERQRKDILHIPPELIRRSLVDALHGMASLYVNAGKPEKIIEWADKAIALDPRDRFALWNRALGYLESGQWAKGWEAYDTAGFMVTDGLHPIERKLKTYGGLPRWTGPLGHNRYGSLMGHGEKPLVICYGEQGIGDEVMFASMLPDLMRDCRVIIDCDARLEALFKRSFPEAVAVYPTSDRDAPYPWIADHEVDAFVPMGSLGRYYRPDSASFPRTPYLKADQDVADKWRNYMGSTDKLRVGISWAGGLKKTRFDQRTIPLLEWRDILSVPGIEWWSLQYHHDAAQEAADVGRITGVPVHHWADVIASYDKTAGFLQNLDLVITVNTSLVHLAGALGVETWCLTPAMVAWRYGCSGGNPFYGSVEMLRQEKPGEWEPVLVTVRETLAKLTAMREAA
jgi:tetratricopeptide repeat protein